MRQDSFFFNASLSDSSGKIAPIIVTRNIPSCKHVKLVAYEIPSHLSGTYSSMYLAMMTPLRPMAEPTINLLIKKTSQYCTKAIVEPTIPTMTEMMKAQALPCNISVLAEADPTIAPIAGMVFISATLRSSYFFVSQLYFYLRSGVHTFIY